ncbi:peptide deformylase [Desulfocicer vacuolatum DSM 3385]|uniref:Peptide deformylase n=1 Tax=Desulfocicer vacuolatum DSM 3385 TaxID=1121400 RepID=A0A1W1ZEG8_9BACT|nr:peptide deformylase [Desulfocicer vacuolatum]SMC46793.1 peptide deformylase [Desulfocicer vacuolatum DSM 3385]
MAILKILEYPDPFLAQKAKPVEEIDKKILKLIKDMAETMFDAPGVGLAAPQVGSDLRVIVYNPDAGMETEEEEEANQKNSVTALINPEIISASGQIVSENEACLSVPDYSADVKRSEKVTVRALNKEGKKLEFSADGIQAVILQHEIDHLDGTLYIDRISKLKRNMYRKKITKRQRR